MSTNRRSASPQTAVIGAGWAGCAAAVELSRRGHRVTLLESARIPGGRARCIDLNGKTLDNGQHILLGAYTETLRLLRVVGMDSDQVFLRLPLQIRYPADSGGMNFTVSHLPAPFHLIAALWQTTGLTKADKRSLVRFFTIARWRRWSLDVDCSVSALLKRFSQTNRVIQLLWRPLCIASLNTPPERASAQIFLNVLRDSLGAHRMGSDILMPRVDLTTLFPKQATLFIMKRHGAVCYGTTVKKVTRCDTHWQIHTSSGTSTADTTHLFDNLVVATPPIHAAILLNGLIDIKYLASFQYEPITTCYLQYGPKIRLPHPFFALPDVPANQEWGQFVFDRGWLDPGQAGLLAVVVSASTEAIALGHDALANQISIQLAKLLHWPELAHPKWVKVISEKRATFSCTPGLVRPKNATEINNLALAGDYTAGDYPATLESAVRSGVQAALTLIR